MVNEKVIEEVKKRSIVGVAVLPIVKEPSIDSVEDKEYDLFANSKYHPPLEEEQPKRSKAKKVNLTVKQYRNRLAICTALSAVVALSGLGLSKKAIEKYKNTAIIATYANDFEKNVLAPERFSTLDHLHYYYEYSDIAEKIMSSENIDETVYIMLYKIGTEQANDIMARTPYKSLENFYKIRNYKDEDDFRKKACDMLLLDDEIKTKQRELDEMNKEHREDSTFNYSSDSYFDFYEPYSGGVK